MLLTSVLSWWLRVSLFGPHFLHLPHFLSCPTQAPHYKQVSSPFLFGNLKAVADAVLNPALSVCSHHLLWSLLLRAGVLPSQAHHLLLPQSLCPPYLPPLGPAATSSCFSSIFLLPDSRHPTQVFSIQWHPCSALYHAPFPSSQGATLKKTLHPHTPPPDSQGHLGSGRTRIQTLTPDIRSRALPYATSSPWSIYQTR